MSELTRPWEVYLVHHSHVDIGYTEPQRIVTRKHADYIAQALGYCSATDHLPPGERFVWTCEVSWTARTFLERYPERAEEFFRRVREGRIEVTGIYVQLTDLFGEELLVEALDYAVNLGRENGFQVVTGMQSDVNGWAWGLPRMMAERGIRYFDTAINETRALGVRPRPHPFYWASPDGSRVLMWHGEHYMRGNSLRLDGSQCLLEYLSTLEESGYPHSATAMRVQGARHDNAPPGVWLCDAVREWNSSCENVKLRLCTPRAWFEHLEAHWPEPIPELKKAWPDWWADGHGSALYEVALVRKAQADLLTAKALQAAGAPPNEARYRDASQSAMLFCEHTWGAWCSTDDPDALESKAQWNVKSGFVYTAAAESASLVTDALSHFHNRSEEGPTVLVFNPLRFERSDVVELCVEDRHITGEPGRIVLTKEREDEGPDFHLVDAETGEEVPVARTPAVSTSARLPAQEVSFMATGVPALGSKRYRIVPGALERKPVIRGDDHTLENAHFRLKLDPSTGGIAGLIDLRLGREVIGAGYALNQYIHEFVDSPEGREAICTWAGPRYDAPFVRTTPEMRLCTGEELPFGARLTVQSGGGDLPELRSRVILYDDLPRVDIVNTLTRLPVDRVEAVYHAFPINAEEPTVYLDLPGAVMRPGTDQVPGTATDWHSIQRYFAVSDRDFSVTVASPDVPLVQVNGINTGRWQESLPKHNGLVMSWVTNNYWFTNFPATQSGSVRYRYSLFCRPGPFDPEASARFASSIRTPLLAEVCVSV